MNERRSLKKLLKNCFLFPVVSHDLDDHHLPVCFVSLILWWWSSHLRSKECGSSILSSASWSCKSLWSTSSSLRDTHVRYHRFLPWWWYTIYSIDFKTTYTRIPTPQWDVNHIDYQHNYQNNCGRTRKWNRMACLTLLLLAVLRLACVLSSR